MYITYLTLLFIPNYSFYYPGPWTRLCYYHYYFHHSSFNYPLHFPFHLRLRHPHPHLHLHHLDYFLHHHHSQTTFYFYDHWLRTFIVVFFLFPVELLRLKRILADFLPRVSLQGFLLFLSTLEFFNSLTR